MYDLHVSCAFEQFQPLVAELEARFQTQPETACVLDWGCSQKQQRGFVVVEWLAEELDDTFLAALLADGRVEDVSVYLVPQDEDAYPFGHGTVCTPGGTRYAAS